MNLPNKITLARIVLIPVFVVFMLVDIPYNNVIACTIFCVACISDFLDGYIARKYKLVTTFGKFADPLADKLLVGSALILFVGSGLVPEWIAIIVIGREFIISGVRLVAADAGVVIAASMWGKVKTVVQMFMSIFLIANFDNEFMNIFELVLIYLSVILSVVSLLDYLLKNKHVFKD